MNDDDLLKWYGSVADSPKVPLKHRHRTEDCPLVPRYVELSYRPAEATTAELQHMIACRYCEMMIRFAEEQATHPEVAELRETPGNPEVHFHLRDVRCERCLRLAQIQNGTERSEELVGHLADSFSGFLWWWSVKNSQPVFASGTHEPVLVQ